MQDEGQNRIINSLSVNLKHIFSLSLPLCIAHLTTTHTQTRTREYKHVSYFGMQISFMHVCNACMHCVHARVCECMCVRSVQKQTQREKVIQTENLRHACLHMCHMTQVMFSGQACMGVPVGKHCEIRADWDAV